LQKNGKRARGQICDELASLACFAPFAGVRRVYKDFFITTAKVTGKNRGCSMLHIGDG